MANKTLDFDVINPLDGDDYSALVTQKEETLASLKTVEEALPSLGEEARTFIRSGIGEIRATIYGIPTGPTMSRYAGGPDALDLSMIESAAREAATLVSIITLPKDQAIELVAAQLRGVIERMGSLEKLTKSMRSEGADVNFSGEAAKQISAKARLLDMIHGNGTLYQIVQQAVEGLEEAPEVDALSGFARIFGALPDEKERAKEKAQNPEFSRYKKNKGMMTAEQFEKVQAVQVTDGHTFKACLLVQDAGFHIPDDGFLDAMARLVAVFGDEEKAKKPGWVKEWLIPETYILLGRIDGK